jgi:dihydroflavonol-4-reductase
MILLTGASGLLGSHIVRSLVDRGEQLRCLRRSTSDLSLLGDYASRVAWVEGDVTDVTSLHDAMQGIDRVYHCAALISMRPSDLDRMMHINTEGTANIVNAALDAGIKRMLYVSSVAAFGRPEREDIVIDELLDIKDSTDNYSYFRSKLYAEREVWRGIAEGLEAVIINPSTIIGGGFWHMTPNNLFKLVYEGLPYYARGVNAFVDVRDVAAIAIRLMDSSIVAEKYIVSADNLAFDALSYLIADALQVKRPSLAVSPAIAALSWRWEAIKSRLTSTIPLITSESADMSMRSFRYSHDKVCAALDYSFRPLPQTIADVAALYLQSVKAQTSYGILPN